MLATKQLGGDLHKVSSLTLHSSFSCSSWTTESSFKGYIFQHHTARGQLCDMCWAFKLEKSCHTWFRTCLSCTLLRPWTLLMIHNKDTVCIVSLIPATPTMQMSRGQVTTAQSTHVPEITGQQRATLFCSSRGDRDPAPHGNSTLWTLFAEKQMGWKG